MMGAQKTRALKIFNAYMKRNEIWGGQLASTKNLFRRKVMEPILKIIADMEENQTQMAQ